MPTEQFNLRNVTKREELVAKILKIIEEEGPIGRHRLCKILKLSSANKGRRIIDELMKRKLISMTIHGVVVTENWKKMFKYQLNKSIRTLRNLIRRTGK